MAGGGWFILERGPHPTLNIQTTNRNLISNKVNMSNQNLIRVYLDDERPTPSGWVRVYWPSEAIALLESGCVQELSLDHDLGDDQRGTGYDVILWIEEAVALRSFTPPIMHVHSANSSAREKMLAGIRAIERMLDTKILITEQPVGEARIKNKDNPYESMETAMGTHSLTREQRAQRVLKDESA